MGEERKWGKETKELYNKKKTQFSMSKIFDIIFEMKIMKIVTPSRTATKIR